MAYMDEIKEKYYPESFSLTPDLEQATVKIELTNICNHRCLTCPHSKMHRKGQFMEKSLAYRIISECADYHVEKIALFLNGEPFLVEDIDQYVALCRGKGIPYVFLTTNGSVCSKNKIEAVMEAGLSSLKFSINASTPEMYETVHGVNSFFAVLDNLRYARQYRDSHNIDCRILAGCVLTDYSKNSLEQYSEIIGEYADDLLFLKPDNFGGYMVEEISEVFHDDMAANDKVYGFDDKRLPCPLLFNSINVTVEGYLALCCSEALNFMVVEDVNKMSIQEAWHSKRMQEIRKRHLDKQIRGMQCYNCINNSVDVVRPINPELFSSPSGRFKV